MQSNNLWEQVEGKMVELRILTEANWRGSEWELAALGERVLRTAEESNAVSDRMRSDAEHLQESIETLKTAFQLRSIHEGK